MVPTVHLNGTSRNELLEQYLDMVSTLRVARATLQKNGPHARDYYTQGDTAIHKAIAEHRARVDQLTALIDELQTIAVEVSNAP